MVKRPYLYAMASFLAIPVVILGGFGLLIFINPEWARGHANYARNFHLLDSARHFLLMSTLALTLALWALCCYWVLQSKQRSPLWIIFGIAGPFGFAVLAMLADRSPTTEDRYQQFIAKLHWPARLGLEVALFFSIWMAAFTAIEIKHEVMTRIESIITGTPMATIVATQDASGGMWAFSEGMQGCYLVVLIYLLWPIAFNLGARIFGPPTQRAA